MKIHHFALALFMLTGQMLYADGNQCAPLTDSTQKFESLQVCRSCVPESDNNRKDSHCQTLMDPYNYCVGKQYISYLDNNASATEDQKNMALATYQNNCTASTTAASTTTTTPTATTTTAQSLADAQRAAAAQAASQDQARAQAAAAAAASGTSVTAGATGNSSAASTALLAAGLPLVGQIANSMDRASSSGGSGGSGSTTTSASDNSSSLSGGASTSSGGGVHTASSGNGDLAGNAAPQTPPATDTVSAPAVTSTADEARSAALRQCTTPQCRDAVNNTNDPNAANADNAPDLYSPEVNQAGQKFVSLQNEFHENIKFCNFTKTSTAISTYLSADKATCKRNAERAQFLCAEGTSPGAQLARGVINVAGPAIALMNSARNACSGSSDFMNLAGITLAAAKGVCVAAKVVCDSSCNSLMGKLQNINTQAATYTVIPQETPQQTVLASGKCEAIKAHVLAATASERNPAPGTAMALIQRCEKKMLDIALFATNIAGIMMAKKSADDCKSQLASNGSSSDATFAQYCQNPANSQTSTCVCQNSPQSPGCPGALNLSSASASGDSTTPTDQAGLRVGNDGGVSGFASGSNGSAAGTGSTALNLGGGSDGSSGLAGIGSGDNSFAGSASPALGGGDSGGGAGGTATGTADAQKSGSGKDKNPWSFGALASTVGGFLSGSYKSGSGSGSAWTEAQQQAVDRRIASDKVAAEISSANGKSNWQKIREQYLSSESTFINGK